MTTNMQKIGGLLMLVSVASVAAAAIHAGRNQAGPREVIASVDRFQTRTEANTNGDKDMFAAVKKINKIEHAGDADFQQKVLDAKGRVLVDFYADWCGPCRLIGPVLEEVAREFPTAQIVKVNVDDSPGLAMKYRIESIPALMVFENGQVVNYHVGVADKARLRSLLGL
jgi:thioredoxin 1